MTLFPTFAIPDDAISKTRDFSTRGYGKGSRRQTTARRDTKFVVGHVPVGINRVTKKTNHVSPIVLLGQLGMWDSAHARRPLDFTQ